MDELHEIIDEHIVARTCIECESVLVMSDYGSLVCTRCEEPQYNKSLEVLDKKIKKFQGKKSGMSNYCSIPLDEAIEDYAQYREALALAVQRGAGVPFIRTFSEWVENEPV
jgi:hypothetical protein